MAQCELFSPLLCLPVPGLGRSLKSPRAALHPGGGPHPQLRLHAVLHPPHRPLHTGRKMQQSHGVVLKNESHHTQMSVYFTHSINDQSFKSVIIHIFGDGFS